MAFIVQVSPNPASAEARVNTYTTSDQALPTIAALQDGGFVTIWHSLGQDGSGVGVYQQRYSAAGVAIGSETRVNTYTSGNQQNPNAAVLNDGTYVVTWQSAAQDGNGSGVYMRRYDASANPISAETLVNSYTTSEQIWPSVTALKNGGFVVTWASLGQDGNDYGIYHQRFDATGAAVGSEAPVNTYTTGLQSIPTVGALADGGYVVTWHSNGQDGSSVGIYLQRFDSAGNAAGSETRVNATTADNQSNPWVAGLPDGSFVVVWQSNAQDGAGFGIYQQRYDASGNTLGAETRVNSYTTSDQKVPRVVSLADGGYLVVWESTGQDGGLRGIYQQRYDGSGVAVGGETRVNTTTATDQFGFGVSALKNGGHVIAWTSAGGQDGAGMGIYQSMTPAVTTMSSATEIVTGDATNEVILVGAGGLNAGDTVNGGAGTDTLRFTGGGTNTAVGATITGIEAIELTNAAGATLTVADAATAMLVTTATGAADHVSLASGAFTLAQRQALFAAGVETVSDTKGIYQSTGAGGPELRVNTTTAGDQSLPAIATLKGGGYVIAFTSSDGSSTGIFQQRYSAAGVALGAETRVNTTTANAQTEPFVTSLSDGGYVVAWQSNLQDGGAYGIYQQRFDASGNAVGAETLVNTVTANDQTRVSMAGLSGGGHVVTWQSSLQDGSSWGVYQQRYDASGAAVGAETSVNITTAGEQSGPAVTALTGGGYVVIWHAGGSQDGNAYGTFQRLYDASGAAITAETRVNSYTTGDQIWASVAALTDGGYVVVWESNGQDGANFGIYLQRYNASGVAVGSEVRVNTTTANSQELPEVAATADGGWVVTWHSNLQDGSANGVYLQRYDASGTPIGGETQVNAYTNLDQFYSDVAGLADGSAVVTWISTGQDGSVYGTYQKLYQGIPNLTAAVDQIAGDGRDEIFLVGAGGLNAGDVVDGGAGADTLRFAGGGANTTVGATITGIEAIELTNLTGTTLTVADKATTLLVTKATGAADHINLASGSFTVAERKALFDKGVETIQDAQGTYQSSNAAPVTVADSITATKRTSTPVSVLANDSDANGDPLSLVSGSLQVTGFTPSQGLTLPNGVTNAALLAQFTMSGSTIAVSNPSYFNFLQPGESLTINLGYQVTDNVASTSAGTLSYTVTGDWETLTPAVDEVIGDATDEAILVGASGLNAGDTVNGGAGTDTLTFSGGGTNTAVGATITGIEAIELTNATGTTLTVTNAAMASLVTTATGSADTLILASGSFTVAQRRALFDKGIESVEDAQGLYQSGNGGPITVADVISASENTTTPVMVLANDTDPDLDLLSLVAGSLQVNGVTTSQGLNLPQGLDNAGLLAKFSMNGTSIRLADASAFNFLEDGQSITISFAYKVTDGVASESNGTLAYTIMGMTPAVSVPDSGTSTSTTVAAGTPVHSYSTIGLPSISESPSGNIGSKSISQTGAQSGLVSNVDGDRFDDVLFQNSATGKIGYINMASGKAGDFIDIVASLPQGWALIGARDLTGDGRADIIVQNANTGSIFFANLASGTPAWSLAKGGLIAAQEAIAIGDITGDGVPDLLLKDHGTGKLFFASLDRSGSPEEMIAGPDTGFTWRTIGLGDLNHDGASDVLVQELDTGATAFYDAKNKAWGSVTGTIGPDWSARELADLNGDGFADVVFRNSATSDLAWVDMRAEGAGAFRILLRGANGFELAGYADVDNDGSQDLVMQNQTDGATYVIDVNQGVAGAWTSVTNTLGAQWNAVA